MNRTALVSAGKPAAAMVAISRLAIRWGTAGGRPFFVASGELRNAVGLISLVETPLLCRE